MNRITSAWLSVFVLPATFISCAMPSAAGSTIVATNVSPFQYESSGYRTDVGYSSSTNGGFLNTAHSQRFVPNQSGELTSLRVLIRHRSGTEPLRVAIRTDSGGAPGTLLGEKSFPHSLFPTSYTTPGNDRQLDFSDLGIELVEDAIYHAVFRTSTALSGSWHYSSHIVRPAAGRFGLPYLHSRDGGLTWNSGSPTGLETSLEVSANTIPEPGAVLLVLFGVATHVSFGFRRVR